MKPEVLTLYGYREIRKLGDQVEQWLNNNVRSILEYDKEAIVKRLMQKCIGLITVPFLREQAIHFSEENNPDYQYKEVELRLGDLTINTRSGKMSPSIRLLLSCSMKFFFYWSMSLIIWFLSLTSKKSEKRQAALLYGIPVSALVHNDNDADFAAFCDNGPLPILHETDLIIVESNADINATMPDRFKYGRFLQLQLLFYSDLKLKGHALFIKDHFLALLRYLSCLAYSPMHCLLWRDIAEHAAAKALNADNCIKAVIITNSNWTDQFLWMFGLPDRRFKTYMSLYSLNSHPLLFKEDPLDVPPPGSKYLFVDKILIWHESYKQLLLKDGVTAETEVNAPMLWYLPEHSEKVATDDFRMCIFDVTPRTNRALLDVTGNEISYYNIKNIKQFYADILYAVKYAQVKSGKSIKVLVKRKREVHYSDDDEYNKYLNQLSAEHENFIFIDHDFNLYSLIEDCALSISIPFSSPAYVANFLKKRALFYDPTDSILFNHPDEPLIEFISDRDRLAESILSAIEINDA